MIGLISDIGLGAAYIFSLGALIFTFTIRTSQMFKNKRENGQYWQMSNSNFFKVIDESGRFRVNWINFVGLIIRTLLNIAFQVSIMLAFKNAKLANMNQGIITSLLSMYCVFTTVIFYFVFGEKLQ